MNDIISRTIRRSIALKQSMGPCHTRRADLTSFKSISPVFTVIRSIIQVTHLIVNARKISFDISAVFQNDCEVMVETGSTSNKLQLQIHVQQRIQINIFVAFIVKIILKS